MGDGIETELMICWCTTTIKPRESALMEDASLLLQWVLWGKQKAFFSDGEGSPASFLNTTGPLN